MNNDASTNRARSGRTRPAAVMVALLAVTIGAIGFGGCQALKDLASFKELQFKLGDVNNFKLAGIDVSNFTNPSNLGITDAAKLVSAFGSGKLPVSFNLDVLAKNPNSTSGASTGGADLFIKKMAWTLYMDGTKTITGTVNKRLKVPASGATETIPITMSLDLLEFFEDEGYEDLLNLAFALGGVSGSSSRLKMTANVTVETPIGDVAYPGEITIINTEFSGD